jgi:hypothetical protein
LPVNFPDDNSHVHIPSQDGSESFFVVQSPSYVNWLILRGFLEDGKPDAAVQLFKQGVKIYPLSQAGNPPAMEFFNLSKAKFNTIHANDEFFYTELNQVIQKEPASLVEPELLGQAAAIGIEKGKPFAPDERMLSIFKDAAAVGNATARAITFDMRGPDVHLYEDSQWKVAFLGGDYRWLKDGGRGGRNQDARTAFFYFATVNTPAMVLEIVGSGSQYAWIDRDSNSRYLDGSKAYTLNIPADVPAKDFWSVVIYDPQTRSQLQTGQPFPSRNNKTTEFIKNEDGSVDLYFSPEPPKGKENNWIQPYPVRAGLPFCAFTVRSSRGLINHGAPERFF